MFTKDFFTKENLFNFFDKYHLLFLFIFVIYFLLTNCCVMTNHFNAIKNVSLYQKHYQKYKKFQFRLFYYYVFIIMSICVKFKHSSLIYKLFVSFAFLCKIAFCMLEYLRKFNEKIALRIKSRFLHTQNMVKIFIILKDYKLFMNIF